MLGRRIDNAGLQSEFYRNTFRKTLRWLIFSLLLTFILIAAIVYFVLRIPEQQYFANTTDGLLMPMPQAFET